MRRVIAIIIILSMMIVLVTGCSATENEKTYTKSFIEYYANTYNDKLTKTNFIIYNDWQFGLLELQKEKKSSNPKVIMSIVFKTTVKRDKNKSIHDFCLLEIPEQKEILKYLGDMVVEYAKNNEWKNDYYLYIQLSSSKAGKIIYNYETNAIYIPKDIDIYLKLYDEFGTFDVKEIPDTEANRNWLKYYGFAKEKHGELEYIPKISQYELFIINGEFKSYYEDYSNRY